MLIKALNVTQVGKDLFRIELPSRPLVKADHDTIARLLPDLGDAFYQLLEKQNLLDALTNELPPDDFDQKTLGSVEPPPTESAWGLPVPEPKKPKFPK